VAITTRQRSHYAKMSQQEEARTGAIRALVKLSQFPDDSDAAIRSLRLLDAAPAEIEAATNALMMTQVEGWLNPE
jgi:hypothetical protein